MAKVGSVPNLVHYSEHEGNPLPRYEGREQQLGELDKAEVSDA